MRRGEGKVLSTAELRFATNPSFVGYGEIEERREERSERCIIFCLRCISIGAWIPEPLSGTVVTVKNNLRVRVAPFPRVPFFLSSVYPSSISFVPTDPLKISSASPLHTYSFLKTFLYYSICYICNFIFFFFFFFSERCNASTMYLII